jgi:hypothetical protein
VVYFLCLWKGSSGGIVCVDVEVKMGKGNRFKEVQLEFDFIKKLRRKFFQRKTKGKDGKA